MVCKSLRLIDKGQRYKKRQWTVDRTAKTGPVGSIFRACPPGYRKYRVDEHDVINVHPLIAVSTQFLDATCGYDGGVYR